MLRPLWYREFIRSVQRALVLLPVLVLAALSACEPANRSGNTNASNSNATTASAEPTIEASPVSKTDDQWQVISANNIMLSVTAPGAQAVTILYRPAFAEGRHVELKKLNAPTDAASGKFSSQFKVPSDFAGDVWAEVSYRDGTKKETKPISLTVESISTDELANASYKHSEESARSDKITGGHIEQTALQPGNA